VLIGGFLLLWVCWKLWRELHASRREAERAGAEALAGNGGSLGPPKTFRQALVQIVVADVSMSLDNVLAVAGAAQRHFEALVFGLALSVVLMGVASSLIARLLSRFRWIAWVGLAVILYVAMRMIYEGADQVLGHSLPAIPFIKGPMPLPIPPLPAFG